MALGASWSAVRVVKEQVSSSSCCLPFRLLMPSFALWRKAGELKREVSLAVAIGATVDAKAGADKQEQKKRSRFSLSKVLSWRNGKGRSRAPHQPRSSPRTRKLED